jgi:hypothetical protein
MPQHPTSHHRPAPRPRPAAEPPTRQLKITTSASNSTESAAAAKAPDLTVNKVVAGAGAAATSAVLGSYFGATGTVMGAALGSVASTVATVVYQRSLDRTRDTLVARVRLTPGRRTDVAVDPRAEGPVAAVQLPAPRTPADQETVRLSVEPDVAPRLRMPRRRALLWAGATVLVFAIGLLAVTGVEWAKGSTLTTGESGTSVGRVFDGGGAGGAPADEEQDTTPTSEPSDSSDSSDPTGSADSTPQPSDEPSEDATPSDSPESDTTRAPEESRAPGLGNEEGSLDGNGGRDDQRDAPERTRLVPVPPAPGE